MVIGRWLSYDDFAGRTGERFRLLLGEHTALELVLTEATQGTEPGGVGPDGRSRLQFSVVFRGPAQPLAPQATYRLEHPELEDLELFLVPLGPDADGMRYEAAFA